MAAVPANSHLYRVRMAIWGAMVVVCFTLLLMLRLLYIHRISGCAISFA